jgi:hypothetical protein
MKLEVHIIKWWPLNEVNEYSVLWCEKQLKNEDRESTIYNLTNYNLNFSSWIAKSKETPKSLPFCRAEKNVVTLSQPGDNSVKDFFKKCLSRKDYIYI